MINRNQKSMIKGVFSVKKFLSSILAMLVVSLSLPHVAWALYNTVVINKEIGKFKYDLFVEGDSRIAYVKGFKSSATATDKETADIPKEVEYTQNGVTNKYTVTRIDENAFKNNTDLTSVTIPEGVTTIDQYAFNGCANLTSVTIPGSIKYIYTGAFAKTGLTSVTFPKGLMSIGKSAFEGCEALTSVTIPEDVVSICENAFSDCTALKSVTISKGVTTIYDYAFSKCKALTSVTIPKGVETIGEGAFYECKDLTSVTIPEGVRTIGRYAFYECSKLTSVTIPDSVETIGDYAFSCTSLKSVTIPGSVTDIDNNAFYLCKSLTSVTIPEGVKTIGKEAFLGCDALTSVTIPKSVKNIDESAFAFCRNLATVNILNSNAEISDSAFFLCDKLKTINVPCNYHWGGNIVGIPVSKTLHKFTKRDGNLYTCTVCDKTEEILTLGASVEVNGQTQRILVRDINHFLPEDTQLEVNVVGAHEELDVPDYEVQQAFHYEITLLDRDGNRLPMPLQDNVELLFEVIDGVNKSDLEVVLAQIGDDIQFEENLVNIDGVQYVGVLTNHFSPYSLIDKLTDADKAEIEKQTGINVDSLSDEEKAQLDAALVEANKQAQTSSSNSNNVKTGDETGYIVSAALFTVLIAGIYIETILKKKKSC